ncbi:hypothetical protein Nepgr_015193 [Nepenthes gracilis]|uniref:AN1-type domain-containing protein n=1 Tax=Nepenthes gracilis TaxID=150966 RepID=A0AAD3SMU4_NEPGR|nr:hypothetical protein Nepgr_015193 [Nepenthes gracilis]
MGGGTEAFPDLGRHCQRSDCNQLDFLPFNCDGCQKVYCLEHRSYEGHECPKSGHRSRKVIVCDTCSTAIETTGKYGEDEKEILERHVKSQDCNPSKKKREKCPVKRCKEVLTFSNAATCKSCQVKVCLKHRFPADHDCKRENASSFGGSRGRLLAALPARTRTDCGKDGRGSVSPPSNVRPVEAY